MRLKRLWNFINRRDIFVQDISMVNQISVGVCDIIRKGGDFKLYFEHLERFLSVSGSPLEYEPLEEFVDFLSKKAGFKNIDEACERFTEPSRDGGTEGEAPLCSRKVD